VTTSVKLTADLVCGFAGGLLSKGFDEPAPTPDCHREWWEMACSDHQYVAIAAPRGHAKTTALTKCYTLAAVLFRSADFVLLVSDTYNQACLFLGEIKRELFQNEDLIELFNLKREFVVDRENDIIVETNDGHQFRIIALGSEQKVRGMLWNGRRPNLIVGDDLENDEIVMNPDRREKFRNWVYNALLPCLSERGKARIVGTILHMGSFLEGRMPKDQSENSIHSDLCVRMRKPDDDGWYGARYCAHGPNGKFDSILWPVKWTEKRLRQKRAMYVNEGNPEGYSQEYLNRPIDGNTSFFRQSDFVEFDLTDLNRDWKHSPTYLSCDLAVSTKERRDFSVFGIGSIDDTGKLYIRHVVHERLDSKEIVDMLVHLYMTYKYDTILIGKGTLEKAIGPYLRDEMQKRGFYPSLEAIPEVIDKRSRATSIRGRMRAQGVKFDSRKDWFHGLRTELLQFDRGIHDDQVDMMALFGMYLTNLIEAPTKEQLVEEDYATELQLSGLADRGRSGTTGY
jgi:predicted phage terminase large subunit-like protein